MFFHTSEEIHDAKIHGITDAIGITLIQQNHPFPLLVEEEERVHGALLANTTHGALFRFLGCMSDIPNMPFGLSFSPQSEEFPPAIQILNTLKYLRDQMILDSIQTHEGFAKYLAYCLVASGASNKMKSSISDDLEENRQRYWLLDELCKNFVHPLEHNSYGFALAFVYPMAKAVLNSHALLHLTDLSNPTEFWNTLKSGGFAADLDDRVLVGLRRLDDLVNGKRANVDASKFLNEASSYIYSVVADQLRLKGHQTTDPVDPTSLIIKTALLGKRMENMAKEGLYCSEQAPFVGFGYDKSGSVVLDRRTVNDADQVCHSDIYQVWLCTLNSDPALRVFYAPKHTEEEWKFGQIEDLSTQNWSELAVFVTPAFQEQGAPLKLPNASGISTLRLNLFCFGKKQGETRAVLIPHVDWDAAQAMFSNFKKDSLVLVTNKPFIPGPTISVAPVEELAELMGRHAPVVYWNNVARAEDIVDESAKILLHEDYAADAPLNSRGPCGVVVKRRNYTTMSCVPRYVVSLVRDSAKEIRAQFKDNNSLRLPAENLHKPIHKNDEALRGAALAYELMYRTQVLPSPLPYCFGTDLYSFLSKY